MKFIFNSLKEVVGSFGAAIVAILAVALVGWGLWNGFIKLKPLVSTRLGLEPTALEVKEIKEIGELISAEYFSEFIHASHDSYFDQDSLDFKSFYDTLKANTTRIYDSHVPPPNRNRNENTIWNRTVRDLRATNLFNDRRYHFLLTRRENEASINRIDDTRVKQILSQIRAVEWEVFYNLEPSGTSKAIFDYRIEKLNAYELYYLCRGWVKAGYDLSQIKQAPLNPSGDTIFIDDLDPYILVVDINPWFIPPQKGFKEGVPGYQLIRASREGKDLKKEFVDFSNVGGKKKVPFDMAMQTKSNAKLELLKKALENNILEVARKSAEESLLAFFSFSNQDSGGIQKVVLNPTDEFREVSKEKLSTNVMSYVDLKALDPWIKVPYFTIDSTAIEP